MASPTHGEADRPKCDPPASRDVQILPLAQESAADQTASREKSFGLAGIVTSDWRWCLYALLWPWARNSAHLNPMVGAVIDIKALWRGCLLHVARPFSQAMLRFGPRAGRGVPVMWPLTVLDPGDSS